MILDKPTTELAHNKIISGDDELPATTSTNPDVFGLVETGKTFATECVQSSLKCTIGDTSTPLCLDAEITVSLIYAKGLTLYDESTGLTDTTGAAGP
jgi:hypothetical protein